MADSSTAESQARAQIGEDLSFMLRLTAAIQQPPPRTPAIIDTISSGSWTTDVMEEAIEAPPETKSSASPASQASIEAIPRVPITEIGTDCAICLEVFSIGEEARVMTCTHKFHSGCIEKWLVIHGSCPICRFSIAIDGDDQECMNGGVGAERDRRRRLIRFWLPTRRNRGESNPVSGSGFIDYHHASGESSTGLGLIDYDGSESGESSSGLGEEEQSGDEIDPLVYSHL